MPSTRSCSKRFPAFPDNEPVDVEPCVSPTVIRYAEHPHGDARLTSEQYH